MERAKEVLFIGVGLVAMLLLIPALASGACQITVTAPNGGETWCVGQSENITWISSGTSGVVNIKYSTNGGSSWQTVHSATLDDGTHSWTIPNTPSSNCLVKICDYVNPNCCDQSNSTFTISTCPCQITVTSPNGGENWCVGQSETITWTSQYTGGMVQIRYSTDNGYSWLHVSGGTTDDGSHPWTIPNTPSTNCLVQVGDLYDPICRDQSNNPFTIST